MASAGRNLKIDTRSARARLAQRREPYWTVVSAGCAIGYRKGQRPLIAASAIARLDPPATFHILRHTYTSALAMTGVPMGVIAAQLGHSDARMTERHYAHLAPSYTTDTIRAALPAYGVLLHESTTSNAATS